MDRVYLHTGDPRPGEPEPFATVDILERKRYGSAADPIASHGPVDPETGDRETTLTLPVLYTVAVRFYGESARDIAEHWWVRDRTKAETYRPAHYTYDPGANEITGRFEHEEVAGRYRPMVELRFDVGSRVVTTVRTGVVESQPVPSLSLQEPGGNIVELPDSRLPERDQPDDIDHPDRPARDFDRSFGDEFE